VNLGGRTTDAADVLAIRWKYVPVRRLAVYVEESLLRGVQWAVFEPNDEPRRAHLRMNLTSFMQDLFRKERSPAARRGRRNLLECDAETTTGDDSDRCIVKHIGDTSQSVVLCRRRMTRHRSPSKSQIPTGSNPRRS
jgi:hypothetical protein